MKVIFMGTPDFSVPTLNYLLENHEVMAVFTQPDRPKGRGKKMAFPPVKEAVVEKNIPVYQPNRIKTSEYVEVLKELKPDAIIVVAYGQILSKEILEIPKYGCINVHASLLPKLRGASPINMAIVEGFEKTGVATMQMDVGLDTGDILDVIEMDIPVDMTAGELHDELMSFGPKVLEETLLKLKEGKVIPTKQIDKDSTYAPIIKKEMAKINWELESKKIYNHIRGYNPWPIAYTEYENKRMKIFVSEQLGETSSKDPGTILSFDESGLVVATGDRNIKIKEIQFPNGKRMTVKQYILGNQFEIGKKLGEI